MTLVVPAMAQNEKFDYLFHEAERQKLARKYDCAFELFDYCLKLNPESGAVLYEMANMYSNIHNDSLAIKYLKKASDLYPDNYWYKTKLAVLYNKTKQADEALALAEDMAKRFPNKTEVMMMLLNLYSTNHDYPNMIKVLNQVELKEGKSEQLSMEKFRIYLQMEDEKHAFEEMTALAKEYPNDLRYQVVIGDLYFDENRKEEALRQYKEVEKKDDSNVTLLLSLSNYYQIEGPDSLYQKYMTKLVTHPTLDTPTRARMMAGLVYESLGRDDYNAPLVNKLFDNVLQMPQETNDIYELKVRYLVTKKASEDEVKPYLYKMLDIDPENDMARQQLLAYAVSANDYQGIIDICKPAVDYNANDPVYYYYLGIGYFKQDKTQDAVNTFRQGLDHIEYAGENKHTIISNIYSLLGDLYHDLGQDEKAYLAYDSCLIYKPNDAAVLNNYAYYLSLNKKNLQKAEEMSRKANELSPDNPTYLDTHAWVLFQLKRYKEAKVFIDLVQKFMDPEELKKDKDVLYHIDQINKKAK